MTLTRQLRHKARAAAAARPYREAAIERELRASLEEGHPVIVSTNRGTIPLGEVGRVIVLEEGYVQLGNERGEMTSNIPRRLIERVRRWEG